MMMQLSEQKNPRPYLKYCMQCKKLTKHHIIQEKDYCDVCLNKGFYDEEE